MTMQILSAEVLFHIFQRLTQRKDLCSVSLVSRALRDEAQQVLFRHPGCITIGSSRPAHCRLLHTIISSPNRLARAIHSWDQELVINTSTPEKAKAVWIQETERALALMVNLKILRFRVTDKRPTSATIYATPIPNILRGCTFQLQVFEWDCNKGDEERLVADFLPRQHMISDLTLSPSIRNQARPPNRDFYTSASQLGLNLESFSGTAEMTVPFLIQSETAQPVLKYLRWTDGPSGNYVPNFNEVASALSGVRILHYDYDPTVVGPSLSQVAPFFMDLSVLRMEARNIRDIKHTHYKSLASISTLRILVFALEDELYNYNPASEVAAKVFSRCKQLHCVQFQDGMDALLYTVNSGKVKLRVILAGEDQEYSWDSRRVFV